MITPGRTVLFLLAMLAALLLGALVVPWLVWVALLGDALIIGLCLLEGLTLAKEPVTATRQWPKRVQIGQLVKLQVRIENRGNRSVQVSLVQPWPEAIQAERQATRVQVGSGEVVVVAFEVTPIERGQLAFAPLEVSVAYGHDVARYRTLVTEGGKISVYPNLKQMASYDLLRRSRALVQMGVHRQRMMGVGKEFEMLRDYLPDDDYRNINWKATARRQRPVTNLYQAERSRDVMICVDAGRMMGNPIGNGIALDSVIDAAVLLAHVSNRQGDRVGLTLFTNRVDDLLKPARGSRAVNGIIEHLVDVRPTPRTPSYAALVEALRSSLNHRSLVFIFTDLNDPQLARDLADFLPLIARRHLVVTVSLRDLLMDQYALAGVSRKEELYQVLAARELASERDERQAALAKAGVQTLEADVHSLSLEVINRYMVIKSRQLL